MNATLQVAQLKQTIGSPAPHIAQLEAVAAEIRRIAIAAIYHATSGHPGGSLSCADILAVLYGTVLNLPTSDNPDVDRDRFVLSKGHAAPALYATWAAYGLMSQAEALTLRKLGSRAQGHPHVLDCPLAESSTGSLGQGFSVAIGMAMGLRLQVRSPRVYALLGDGELQEGEVWEGAMCAAHHGLSNLCAVIDYNKLQSDDRNAAIMGLEPLAQKWRAFGWNTLEINGHDIPGILAAFDTAKNELSLPTVIIAHTTKGKGVGYMEDQPLWHGSVKLTPEQVQQALTALGTETSKIESLINGRG
ncbi:MAG: transketolase [Alphaproteobacteria bacterium]|nr:transketolase [Alphaproteobacteria bacterium]